MFSSEVIRNSLDERCNTVQEGTVTRKYISGACAQIKYMHTWQSRVTTGHGPDMEETFSKARAESILVVVPAPTQDLTP